MASSVSICSNALLALGDKSINDFNDPSDRARISANLYPSVRDFILRSHPWNCAIKRVLLSPDSDSPAFGYASKFTLPGDWLRTLQVGEDGERIDYVTESKAILSNETVIRLRYLFRNEDESSWDSMLIHCMELAMQAAMAYSITQSTSKEELCLKKLESYLRQTRSADGQEDPPETMGDFPLLSSRF